jgi:two-component system response regulator AtoC
MASHVPLSMAIPGVAVTQGGRDHAFVAGTSASMRSVERMMADIACTDIPVLLAGESGTGKEEVAVRIHQLSGRQSQPFVKVICAALGSDSLDEILRGPQEPAGAEGSVWYGTVFFDEVSELDSPCQVKLLHSLPDGDAVPNLRSLRARIISATSQNLDEEVRRGKFRKELYYRLKGACLRLPPLRERKEDIPALVEFFLTKHSSLLGRPRPTISLPTLQIMRDYAWPGNIRELENVVKKVVALGDESVAVLDLDPSAAAWMRPEASAEKLSLKKTAREASRHAERELILQVLNRVRWNRKRAAQELQISYKALLYKLKQMGLDNSATP